MTERYFRAGSQVTLMKNWNRIVATRWPISERSTNWICKRRIMWLSLEARLRWERRWRWITWNNFRLWDTLYAEHKRKMHMKQEHLVSEYLVWRAWRKGDNVQFCASWPVTIDDLPSIVSRRSCVFNYNCFRCQMMLRVTLFMQRWSTYTSLSLLRHRDVGGQTRKAPAP